MTFAAQQPNFSNLQGNGDAFSQMLSQLAKQNQGGGGQGGGNPLAALSGIDIAGLLGSGTGTGINPDAPAPEDPGLMQKIGGATGGALSGAKIGGAFGGPVGAGVGAAIGGVGGFFR